MRQPSLQSPAIAMAVEREREIQGFVSHTHYTAVLHFKGPQWNWQATWQFTTLRPGNDETLWLDRPKAALVSTTRQVIDAIGDEVSTKTEVLVALLGNSLQDLEKAELSDYLQDSKRNTVERVLRELVARFDLRL